MDTGKKIAFGAFGAIGCVGLIAVPLVILIGIAVYQVATESPEAKAARIEQRQAEKRALTSMMLLKGMVEAPFGRGNATSVAEMVHWLQLLAPRMKTGVQQVGH